MIRMINDLILTYFCIFALACHRLFILECFAFKNFWQHKNTRFYAFRKGGGIQDIFVAKILMHKMKILFTPVHILLHSFLLLFFSINAQKLWWNMLWYCECNMKEKFEIWAFRLIFKRKKWGQDEIQNNAKVFTISYIHRQLFINMKVYSHDKLWFYENFAKIK